MTVDEYFARSRRLSVSLTFVLPLLVAYEVGVLVTRSASENAVASYLFKGPLMSFFGQDGFLVFNAILTISFLAAYSVAEDIEGTLWDLYLAVLVESAAFAVMLGTVVLVVVGAFYGLPSARELLSVGGRPGSATGVILSMGAGVYEELFFRLFLLGGLLWLLHGLLRPPRREGEPPDLDAELESWTWAALVALVVSSLLFAAAHHVGPHGEPFALNAFAFRYVCGAMLGVLYLWRGLAVAVYTHAFYDILIDLRHFV